MFLSRTLPGENDDDDDASQASATSNENNYTDGSVLRWLDFLSTGGFFSQVDGLLLPGQPFLPWGYRLTDNHV